EEEYLSARRKNALSMKIKRIKECRTPSGCGANMCIVGVN
nr:hypothetical protein [Tanacetum cinerariifolium]